MVCHTGRGWWYRVEPYSLGSWLASVGRVLCIWVACVRSDCSSEVVYLLGVQRVLGSVPGNLGSVVPVGDTVEAHTFNSGKVLPA